MAHPANAYSQHKHHVSKKQHKLMDTAAYIIGIGGSAAVIPQVVRAWQGEAPGLAVSTWIMFSAVGIFWLAYAVMHKQKPLIFAQLANLGVNFAVVCGWLIHSF